MDTFTEAVFEAVAPLLSVTFSVTLYVPRQGLVGVRGPEISWEYRRTDLPSRGIVVEGVLRVVPHRRVAYARPLPVGRIEVQLDQVDIAPIPRVVQPIAGEV